jgi:hypothetical protein
MLSELSVRAQGVFEKFLLRLDDALGEERYVVHEARRSVRVQEAYYAQGRSSLDGVNELRKMAGLFLLRSEKDNYKITWSLKSKHIDGLAMDIVPTDGAGNPTWDLGHYWGFFTAIRDCGRTAGLVCGADWPSPQTDWPHYETRD